MSPHGHFHPSSKTMGFKMKFAVGILLATCTIAAAQKSDLEVVPHKSSAAEAYKDLTGRSPPQDDPTTRQCFEVTMAPRTGGAGFSTDPSNSILLNRCTGETWLMVETSAGKTGQFVFRWYPITTGSSEAVLSPPKPFLSQPKPLP